MSRARGGVLGIGALWLLTGTQAPAQGTSTPGPPPQPRILARPASAAALPPRRCVDAQERVRQIIAKGIGVKPQQLLPNTELVEELGCDSLDAVEVVMAIEEKFGVEIPDGVADKRFRTMQKIMSYLRQGRVCTG